jgi:3-oxoadipate enol-lactonase
VARSSTYTNQAQERFYQSAQHFTFRSFRVMSGNDALLRPTYQPFAIPLHLIVGEHDLPLVLSEATTWHQKEPMSSMVIIPAAGHCANMDNPSEFNRVVLALLNRSTAHTPPSNMDRYSLA